MEEELRSGYTTGTCAAAGTKTALEALLYGKEASEIDITTLNGVELTIPVFKLRVRNNFATCAIVKFAGDDPDVTNGIRICAKVELVKELPQIEKGHYFDKFVLVGGRGVGVATKKGVQVPLGKSAINPGPKKMISEVANELLEDKDIKAVVTIYVPEGKAKSLRTFNPKLGIKGGISILGSTGIVKPMSEEALKDSMYAELKVLKMDKDRDWVVFAFGNYGKNYCERLGLDLEQMIVISNFVGFMVDSAVKLGFKRIILLGHIGKAVKIAGGIFNTHSRVADARMEIMGANAFLVGESYENIRKILGANTVEEACDYVEKRELFTVIAEKVKKKVMEYSRADDLRCESLIFSFKGDTLGYSDGFYELAGEVAE